MPDSFIAAAVSRQDGGPADGVHLLWTAPPAIGYSIDGFDIQRREAQRREPQCYVVSPPELQSLHDNFRLQTPVALIAFRRGQCPKPPDKPPDEPAPDDNSGQKRCTDFSKQNPGTGPNPRNETIGTFLVQDAAGGALAFTRVIRMGRFKGLDCAILTAITLTDTTRSVELEVVSFARPVVLSAFDANGNRVAQATTSAASGEPETVTLQGGVIRRIQIEAKQDETLLLRLCIRTVRRCVDFRDRQRGPGANPLTEGDTKISVFGPQAQPAPVTRIARMGNFTGLDCGFTAELAFALAVPSCELTLVHFARPASIDALRRDGSVASTAVLSPQQGVPETVTLTGAIARVVIRADLNETLLLGFCITEESKPPERCCTDFRVMRPGRGPNPREHEGMTFKVHRSGHLQGTTEIRSSSGHTGLLCSPELEIGLPGVAAVELTLIWTDQPPHLAAFNADGTEAPKPSLAGEAGKPVTVRIEGPELRSVAIRGDRTLLLEACTVSTATVDPEGIPSRMPPAALSFQSASTVAVAATGTSGCVVYDIRFLATHSVVRVQAGLPAMLAIALRESKAVDTRLVAASGGIADALFPDKRIDQVLIYAGTRASSLVICGDPVTANDERSWTGVPFIARNVHLPVRNVNGTLPDDAAEDALAGSRLLSGETFDAAPFREVAQLLNESSTNSAVASPIQQTVLTREDTKDPFLELRAWPYAFAVLTEADWRRMLGFAFLDSGSGLTPGSAYDYRIIGRFRRRELNERLLGFHTVPIGTLLPATFELGSILVETPLPTAVELFPNPPANALRAVGQKGIRLAPKGPGGRCATLTFPTPVRAVILEFEPGSAVGLAFQARTSDYIPGLSGSVFSGPVPAGSRRVRLDFAEPVDIVRLFGAGFLYGVRLPTVVPTGAPDDVLERSVVIAGIVYAPTAAPASPPFLGTVNLQQPQLPGNPQLTTQNPPQHLGFRVSWLPPAPAGGGFAPFWPPDLAAYPPFDVLNFRLERRRVDTGGPFVDVDESKPPTRFFGSRSARRKPPQLYPGIDLTEVFPEYVTPEPPISIFMDAEDTLRSLAKPAGPPPGSLHQYRMWSVDVIGRQSVVPTLGSVVRLEKRVPPPQPVGPTIAPPAGVERTAGVSARVLQSLDTRLTPADVTLLGASTNAIVLEWAWTQAERDRDPFATEFRVYFRALPPDMLRGSLTGAAMLSGGEWQMSASLNLSVAADALAGRYIRSGPKAFRVVGHTAGQNITIRFSTLALDPALPPVATAFELPLPPDPGELRPSRWPERTAVVPISAQENYRFVFRDRLTPSATQPEVRVWVGVSSADNQAYIPDEISSAVPNGGRAGNESSIAAIVATARYLGRPVFTVPPPLPAVPEFVTNEPAGDRVTVRLDLPGLLPAVSVAAGFKVQLERIPVDALVNRISARNDDTIGARLPDDTTTSYTLANPGDQAAFLAQIRSSEPARVEGRFIMDFLLRHIGPLESLWERALPAAVPFGPAVDTLPGKAERYVHRIRLVDPAGHVSAGGGILPQFVRVPSLASPTAPELDFPASATNTVTLTARVREVFEIRWLVLFTLAVDEIAPQDQTTLEKPQLLRLSNRRDLYPNDGIRVRLADGTLLAPTAVVDVSTGVLALPDRVLTVPLTPGFGKRVSLWALAMTRDGVTSRLAGPATAFTGPPPLVVPALSVTSAAGSDHASWPAVDVGTEVALELSTDAGATWTRTTPWLASTVTAFQRPAPAGARQYRLLLRASRDRRATGPAVAPA